MVFVLIFFRRFSVTRCLKEKGNWKSHNFSFVNFSLYYAIHMSNKVIHSQVLRLWLKRDGALSNLQIWRRRYFLLSTVRVIIEGENIFFQDEKDVPCRLVVKSKRKI